MLEVREGRKGLRKPSAFQHQVTLKPHLHLDIEDQRNESKQTNKTQTKGLCRQYEQLTNGMTFLSGDKAAVK